MGMQAVLGSVVTASVTARQVGVTARGIAVGFTPAWALGTATRGTRTCEQYRPHYSSTSARFLIGTLRTLILFSLETTLSQSLQLP